MPFIGTPNSMEPDLSSDMIILESAPDIEYAEYPYIIGEQESIILEGSEVCFLLH